jgi:hypothetical protein
MPSKQLSLTKFVKPINEEDKYLLFERNAKEEVACKNLVIVIKIMLVGFVEAMPSLSLMSNMPSYDTTFFFCNTKDATITITLTKSTGKMGLY